MRLSIAGVFPNMKAGLKQLLQYKGTENMRLPTACVCLALAASLPLCAAPPNVIIIMADDQGYQDLGCFGSPKIKTPHIDRMAREGIRFTQAASCLHSILTPSQTDCSPRWGN